MDIEITTMTCDQNDAISADNLPIEAPALQFSKNSE
ncbi:hypothetical protein GP2143_10957 [marine gamma proteobacterium HTCC2143]|uniref:Uncharacterized protein n=1 Tax=marine gamma proteobacterium HTCC2143 TaxID=247633 RepID=A0YG61_9GAMM|nr:hypothetical protein GP2143_10957 [marine gamma proteobacterium HTCC2143]